MSNIKVLYCQNITKNHSDYINCFFNYVYPSGIDLNNIEIKEAINNNHNFYIGKKDWKADWIFCYDHDSEMNYLVDSSFFNNKYSRKFSENTIGRYASYSWEFKNFEGIYTVYDCLIDKSLNPLFEGFQTKKVNTLYDKLINENISLDNFIIKESVSNYHRSFIKIKERNKYVVKEIVNDSKEKKIKKRTKKVSKKSYVIYFDEMINTFFVSKLNSLSFNENTKTITTKKMNEICFYKEKNVNQLFNKIRKLK